MSEGNTTTVTQVIDDTKPVKEKKPKSNIGLFIILILVINLVWYAVGRFLIVGKYEAAIEDYKSQIVTMQDQYDSLYKDYESLKDQTDSLLNTITEMQTTVTDLTKQINN